MLLYCLVGFIFYDLFNFLGIHGNQISFDNKEFILHYSFEDGDTLRVLRRQFEVFIDLKKLILICLSLHLGYLALRLGVRFTRRASSSSCRSRRSTRRSS